MIHTAFAIGCGARATPEPVPSPDRIFTVDVIVPRTANDGHPVRVALIIPATEDIEARIGALSAQEWFASAEQFAKDAPGEFEARTWEWIPEECPDAASVDCLAQARVTTSLTLPAERGVIAFARYLAPGPHRATAPPDGAAFELLIGADGPVWSPKP